ncbi:MAG TPA: hypothetical protein VK625_00400, partial [Flavitalea sp.]|nr:hypothetical protein [Flavitalea sp.]
MIGQAPGHISLCISPQTCYSERRLFIGLANAGLTACKLTVINATSNTTTPAVANIHHERLMR